MRILDYIKDNILYLDGGMGTLLQAEGLKPGELPERWNIEHPDVITSIQKRYYDSGSNVVNTNTFGANSFKFDDAELKNIVESAVKIARDAAIKSKGTQQKFVALDIGPLGKLLEPYGDLPFEKAVEVFSKTIKIGAGAGVDLIFIETMNDCYETKAALLAAKESCDLPVFVSNAYSEDGKLMTGTSPEAVIAMLEGMGADAIGANCSLGPKQLKPVIEKYIKYSSVPVLLKPNAGLPRLEDGKTVYDVLPDEFSLDMADYIKMGVRIAGGCCGTTPDYIKKTVEKTKDMEPVPVSEKSFTLISSYSHAVEFDKKPVLIGERINPTGKKRFKEALREKDIDYILDQGISQKEHGAHVLDVNVGLPEIDEVEMIKDVCVELQSIIDLPLQIDTSDPVAMEAALRLYNGKAMINSVNGKEEVMREIFPLVKKYGGLVVCLTLDENGIPDDAQKRVEIAQKIINTADEYGIKKKDLIFDTLAMTVSADNNAALATLESLRVIKHELGCHTSLGVSNVSFGLPNREIITSTFFALALENGLSAAIMNPNSGEMMKTYFSFNALHGLDDKCIDYIENIGNYAVTKQVDATNQVSNTESKSSESEGLQRAIEKGLRDQASEITRELIDGGKAPLDVVTEYVIPALDVVGIGFEKGTLFLPQLLMSAEAAQAAFEVVKKSVGNQTDTNVSRGKFIVATVHGDIHDIGKNIVKLIMENYGFDVIDLGKDVPPEIIVEEAISSNAPIVGLSALMTTTVPAMEETIRQLNERVPRVKTIVGGAVLTKEYADNIHADYYAKDAMATVRYAIKISEEQNENN